MNILKARFYFIVGLHFCTLALLSYLFLAAPFIIEPLALGIFVQILIARIATEPAIGCPLTSLENKLRKELGLPEIKGFIGHYILRRKSDE